MRRHAATALLALLVGACATAAPPPAFTPGPPRTAWIVGQDGSSIGHVTFTEAPKGVLIRLQFSQDTLAPGWHGLHLHQVGDCADFAQGFQASGAHIGHGGEARHGLLDPMGPEPGDLPNLYAPVTGPFSAEFFSPHVTLGAAPIGMRQPLLDADGTALIIHAGRDDQITQPIGGAGARIACAALTLTP